MNQPGLVAILLSFVAGYVDTVGFVALFGLFTAHVTGNLVLIGAALVKTNHGLITKLSALPVFVLVVGATALYARARAQAGRPALPGTLAAQLLFLGGFAAAGTAASPVIDADAPWAVAAGLLGVCAMAIQNATSRLLMGELPPTTVMTGGVTQAAIDLAQLLTIRGADAAAIRKRLGRFVPPVLAFAAGAVAGALAYAAAGFIALLAPMAALLIVLLLTRKPVPTAAGASA